MRLAQRANANPGTKGRPTEQQSHLHISCNNTWIEDGKDECEDRFAWVENSHKGNKWSDVYFNICSEFWTLPRFDRLELAAKVKAPNEMGVTQAEYDMVRRDMYLDDEYDGSDGKTYSIDCPNAIYGTDAPFSIG